MITLQESLVDLAGIEPASVTVNGYEVDTGFAFLSVNAAPAELLKRASEL
jgi:hypothetical protein